MSATTTYRDANATKGRRRPLSQVHLAGPPRLLHQALASLRISALGMAIVAFFLPWHVVHPLTAPSRPLDGPGYTCSGWSHANTTLPLVLLLVLIAISLVPFRRPRFGLAFLLGLTSVATVFGLAYALFDLKHLLDHVEPMVGERIFQRAMTALALLVAADVLATPFLYFWARARLGPARPIRFVSA